MSHQAIKLTTKRQATFPAKLRPTRDLLLLRLLSSQIDMEAIGIGLGGKKAEADKIT